MWKRFLAVYEKIEDIIAGIGLVCGVGIMFVGVVARYIFPHPLTFVDEIGPIFIVWSTLIGYSIALRKHRLTRAHREKQLKMSCQALHNAPPNRT